MTRWMSSSRRTALLFREPSSRLDSQTRLVEGFEWDAEIRDVIDGKIDELRSTLSPIVTELIQFVPLNNATASFPKIRKSEFPRNSIIQIEATPKLPPMEISQSILFELHQFIYLFVRLVSPVCRWNSANDANIDLHRKRTSRMEIQCHIHNSIFLFLKIDQNWYWNWRRDNNESWNFRLIVLQADGELGQELFDSVRNDKNRWRNNRNDSLGMVLHSPWLLWPARLPARGFIVFQVLSPSMKRTRWNNGYLMRRLFIQKVFKELRCSFSFLLFRIHWCDWPTCHWRLFESIFCGRMSFWVVVDYSERSPFFHQIFYSFDREGFSDLVHEFVGISEIWAYFRKFGQFF